MKSLHYIQISKNVNLTSTDLMWKSLKAPGISRQTCTLSYTVCFYTAQVYWCIFITDLYLSIFTQMSALRAPCLAPPLTPVTLETPQMRMMGKE